MSDVVVCCITDFLLWYLRSGAPVVVPNPEISQCVFFSRVCVLCFMEAMFLFSFSAIVRGTSEPNFVLGNTFHAYADDSQLCLCLSALRQQILGTV